MFKNIKSMKKKMGTQISFHPQAGTLLMVSSLGLYSFSDVLIDL